MPDVTASETARTPQEHWVFGYGSLIYKVDFPFLQREVASISGWARRFWQGSHDHRGTPQAPGRVVTLIPDPHARCLGVAYRVESKVFEHLDHREKNGYERHEVPASLRNCAGQVLATIYIATAENPAFLGPADPDSMARHIARASGPSGSNRDYLLSLAEALESLGDNDPHVFDLARRVSGF